MDIEFDSEDADHLEFEIWLKNGYDRGWISDVFCDTHDGPPMSDEEMQEWEEGGDPCSFHVKVHEVTSYHHNTRHVRLLNIKIFFVY